MNKLLTKSLEEGRVDYITRFNPILLNAIEARYVEWIADYFSRYGAAPTLARFKAEFSAFIEMKSKAPLTDIFDQEMRRKKNLYFRQRIMEMEDDLVDGADPTDLIRELDQAFTTTSAEIISSKTYDRKTYFKTQELVPFFIPFVDRHVGGIAKGDLVYLVGRPGSNKTTMAEHIVTQWVLLGMRVLYISNENAPQEVMPRLDAFVAGYNPGHYRFGDWGENDELLVDAAAYVAASITGGVDLARDPVTSSNDVEGLIQQLKPDLVLVDGTYLMTDSGRLSGDWRDLAEVSRNLKRIGRRTRTPILGVIQANRTAEGQKVERDAMAGTDAYLQDADTIVSANIIDGEPYGQVVKSRWGPTPFNAGFRIRADFEHMYISTFEDELKEVSVDSLDLDEDW